MGIKWDYGLVVPVVFLNEIINYHWQVVPPNWAAEENCVIVGENYSLFYMYSLAANVRELVMGHIPESLMPILKSLIVEEEEVELKVPNTGRR